MIILWCTFIISSNFFNINWTQCWKMTINFNIWLFSNNCWLSIFTKEIISIMHDRTVIIGSVQISRLIVCLFFESKFLEDEKNNHSSLFYTFNSYIFIDDIIEININIIITIWSILFMIKTLKLYERIELR